MSPYTCLWDKIRDSIYIYIYIYILKYHILLNKKYQYNF